MLGKNFLTVKEVTHGKGVFASKNFENGEKICDFHGPLLTFAELPTPYDSVADHYVQIGENLNLGPSGGVDDLINHSCSPNSGLKIKGANVALVAIKNIENGEEITWDYSTTIRGDEWVMRCECGSKNCRKIISDFKYLPLETQRKYIDLGIVPEYIKKIS